MQKNEDKVQYEKNSYPPVVSVLGHVDHGKTTLLDAIRKSDIAGREHGGITQKIGASQIEVIHEGKKRKITFIDTPGHEAFSNMRAQGVSAADVVILIVSADDGVMPQTKESIEKILESKLPFIVVITKIDLEAANIEKVKQQLLKESVMLEGYGGDVSYIGVSAKTGERVHDLLDLIILVYDMSGNKKSAKDEFYGVVIESRLDKKRGNVATIVVKNGELHQGDLIFTNKEVGKARAIIDTQNKNAKIAIPGDAIEIIGLKEILSTGSVVYNKQSQKKELEELKSKPKDIFDVATFLANKEDKSLKIVLKTEGEGELEAIKNSLPENVTISFEGKGDINISDVLLAKDFGAIILGFNVNITKEAKNLAENESVFFRIYNIIYKLLEEVEDAAQDAFEVGKEIDIGRATILASFGEDDAKVLGVRVNEGRIALNDNIKLLRGKKEVGRAKITSLKRGKNDVKEVGKGLECGVGLVPQVDFYPGDVLLSYSVKN